MYDLHTLKRRKVPPFYRCTRSVGRLNGAVTRPAYRRHKPCMAPPHAPEPHRATRPSASRPPPTAPCLECCRPLRIASHPSYCGKAPAAAAAGAAPHPSYPPIAGVASCFSGCRIPGVCVPCFLPRLQGTAHARGCTGLGARVLAVGEGQGGSCVQIFGVTGTPHRPCTPPLVYLPWYTSRAPRSARLRLPCTPIMTHFHEGTLKSERLSLR